MRDSRRPQPGSMARRSAALRWLPAVAILAAFVPLTALEVYGVVREGSVRVSRSPAAGREEERD